MNPKNRLSLRWRTPRALALFGPDGADRRGDRAGFHSNVNGSRAPAAVTRAVPFCRAAERDERRRGIHGNSPLDAVLHANVWRWLLRRRI